MKKILWASIATCFGFLGLAYTLFLLKVDCSVFEPLTNALAMAIWVPIALAAASFVGVLLALIRAGRFRALCWVVFSCALAVALFIVVIKFSPHFVFYCWRPF
jgi:hypothetical protein